MLTSTSWLGCLCGEDSVEAQRPSTQQIDAASVERLWRVWREEQDLGARDQLVLSFAPMVKFLAYRKLRELPPHCDVDDLVSSGLLALMGAIERWDPRRGSSLETFLWVRVSGAMLDELRKLDWASRSVRSWERRIRETQHAWQSRHGRAPTAEETAAQLGLTRELVCEHLDAIRRADVLSTNAAVCSSEDDAIELGDTLLAPSGEHDPERSMLLGERINVIKQAIGSLSEREQQILSLVYVQHLTGQEVSRVLGVTESRVSQQMKEIRRRLRRYIDSYDDDDLDWAA
jgi:RNA polymerase sigma factor for flagellar operon FliA